MTDDNDGEEECCEAEADGFVWINEGHWSILISHLPLETRLELCEATQIEGSFVVVPRLTYLLVSWAIPGRF